MADETLRKLILAALTSSGLAEEEQPLPALLTNTQVMEVFNISKGTVRNWVRKGKLKPIRVSHKKVYFRQSDIQKLTTLDSDAN